MKTQSTFVDQVLKIQETFHFSTKNDNFKFKGKIDNQSTFFEKLSKKVPGVG